MAATVEIVRLTGVAGTEVETAIQGQTTKSSASDSPSPASSNPVPVPGAGTNYTYWLTTQLKCTVAPTNQINNIRWYTDGVNSSGTGITLKAQEATSYIQATGTLGTSGDELSVGNHSGLTGAPVDAFTLNASTPKTIAGSTAGTGRFGSMLVSQYGVGSTAGAGDSGLETFSWVYDET